jgi:hypothetical protein
MWRLALAALAFAGCGGGWRPSYQETPHRADGTACDEALIRVACSSLEPRRVLRCRAGAYAEWFLCPVDEVCGQIAGILQCEARP